MKVPSFGRVGRRMLSLVQQRNVASGIAVALVSTMVVVAAVQADGSKATNVQLDDGAVWVTNQNLELVGRLNIRVDELDLARQAGPDADVLQQGRDVTFTGALGGVQKMDVIGGQASGKNTVDFADYQMNGGIATLFDPESGRLWVGSSATIVGADYPKKADAQLEPGSRVVVTAGDKSGSIGMVLVVDSTGWFELELDEGFKPVRAASAEASSNTGSSSVPSTEPPATDDSAVAEDAPEPIKVPQMQPLVNPIDETTAVTAVGDRLVFLGDDGSLFSTGGKVARIPGGNAVLQQAGPKNGSVLVASSTGLFEVSIGSDQVKQLATANAAPAQPVRVGECVFGAWSGDEPTWFKACRGEVLVPVSPIPKAQTNAQLVYRVNQRNVAINSTREGGVWADHEGKLAQVGNWDDAQAQQQQLDDALVGQATRESEKQCIEDGSEAPEAGDDELGARPRQSIIDVLYNDDDPNCEPLAIVADSISPASGPWGQLTVIDNGQHLLLSPSQELLDSARTSRQTVEFSYQVEDSTGHQSDPAQVTLAVYDVALGNLPPSLRPIKKDGTTRQMRTVVEEGRSVSYNVTTDWWDPDGDDISLRDAVPERGEVTSSPDGVVRYAANGVTAGPQNVMVTMSDGKADKTEPLEVTVKPAGSPIPPITANDFITLVEGATGTVFPLANDSDSNEDSLALVPDWPSESPGFRVKTVQGAALEITGVLAGTYALKYLASDGVDKTRGTIRLVVLAPDGTNHSPIAVPDKVRMRSDRVVNVDVLANDVDADGDVLAITDVKVPTDGSGGIIRATIIDRRMIQLEVVPGLDGVPPVGPFYVGYTLSDGHGAERAAIQDEAATAGDAQRAQGIVVVSIVPAIIDQPPVATADVVWVRSGDVASIPVLVNDIDPDGDPLALSDVFQDQAAQLEASGSVVSWVAGRSVFLKGGRPGTYPLQYTVLANGKPASGEITIYVTALPDGATNPNNPPAPKALVLRAVRNTTVRLQVPTFGVDRDGDSVTVLDSFGGLAGAAQGSRVEVDPLNPTVILFTAGQNAGTTDEFTYSLRDTYNGVGTATVTVVVLDNQGWPPQAHDDVVRAKPGRTLTVPVLANDTSPQDAPLELAENPFFDDQGQQTAIAQHPDSVTVLDQSVPELRGRIEVKVPQDGSALSEHYRITDGTNPSDAYLRITPDPNAPNLPPVANTDVVNAAEVASRDSVTVDVLRNDFDPDDSRPLAVTLPAGESASVVDGKVTVKVTASPQVVLYRIKDGDGASTVGLIRVPGIENHPPVLTAIGKDPTARTIEASATTPITILLADIVEDPDNDPEVQLTDTEVKVAGGQGTVNRLPGGEGFTYSPPSSAAQSMQVTIQFEVTDRPGVSADERQQPACNCLASLPVVVNVTAASPPTVLSQGNVQVPQLDEPVVYDLAPLVRDDQNDPLTFSIDDPSIGGLTITQGGSQITIVSNEQGLAVGARIKVLFTVTDGSSAPVQGIVWVTIIATNKGQPAAASFPEQNAQRDEALSLPNVIGPATNPFPERPLTLLNPTVDGGAQLSCSPTGDCQFTSQNVGTFRVTYTLRDAANQTAVGTIVVVVKGKPRAPGVPRIESVGDHVVNLTWTAADMQGGTLKTYHVTAVESGQTMQFTTTGGQFEGLTNGSTYHFTVVAENELGMGEPSLASSPAIPDRVPDPPVSPTFTDYGDGTLYLAWAPPPTANDFSPIQRYEVSIGGQTLTTDGSTSVVASGLQNGTDYTFTVRAQNAATTNNGWGESSASSAPERPSRHPDAPSAPSALNSGDGGSPRLTVTWGPPHSMAVGRSPRTRSAPVAGRARP
ncbi:MAG: fibronectin type III domain-containing protein [Acidimicrobiaceae bacterium]|nr:fibronectin type III domain-containing protein [Acidimicrobiaceae bacterium]